MSNTWKIFALWLSETCVSAGGAAKALFLTNWTPRSAVFWPGRTCVSPWAVSAVTWLLLGRRCAFLIGYLGVFDGYNLCENLLSSLFCFLFCYVLFGGVRFMEIAAPCFHYGGGAPSRLLAFVGAPCAPLKTKCGFYWALDLMYNLAYIALFAYRCCMPCRWILIYRLTILCRGPFHALCGALFW